MEQKIFLEQFVWGCQDEGISDLSQITSVDVIDLDAGDFLIEITKDDGSVVEFNICEDAKLR